MHLEDACLVQRTSAFEAFNRSGAAARRYRRHTIETWWHVQPGEPLSEARGLNAGIPPALHCIHHHSLAAGASAVTVPGEQSPQTVIRHRGDVAGAPLTMGSGCKLHSVRTPRTSQADQIPPALVTTVRRGAPLTVPYPIDEKSPTGLTKHSRGRSAPFVAATLGRSDGRLITRAQIGPEDARVCDYGPHLGQLRFVLGR